MYSVINTTNLLLTAVARFESHALAAEWVSRQAKPDAFLIMAEA